MLDGISSADQASAARVRIGESEQAEIVGVVTDTISVRAGEPDEPMVYQPLYTATVASMTPIVQVETGATGSES